MINRNLLETLRIQGQYSPKGYLVAIFEELEKEGLAKEAYTDCIIGSIYEITELGIKYLNDNP